MKSLHVIESLGLGGAERLLVMLLPELKRRGDDVAVAVLKPPLNLRPALEEAGIPVHVLPPHHKWNLAAGANNVADKAQELGSQIIHAHLYFPTVYTGLARMRGLTEARTCVTFHNLAYATGVNKPGPGLWARRQLQARVLPRGFDRMLGISGPVAAHYRESLALPPEALTVLHNPVDLAVIDRAAAAAPDRVHADGRAPVHLVVPGRLVHEKGHRDFLDALERLRAEGLSFTATMAGDGPLRAEIEAAIAAKGLAESVTITGWLAHEDLLAIVAAADIVVVPSRFEGFGLTALEAMALRRAIVATTAGGLVEVIVDGESGLLVPPAAPQAFADAIARLAADPDLCARLGQAGRSRAEERFALPRIVDQLQGIYRDLVSPGREARAA